MGSLHWWDLGKTLSSPREKPFQLVPEKVKDVGVFATEWIMNLRMTKDVAYEYLTIYHTS